MEKITQQDFAMKISFEHKAGVKIYTKLMEEIERFERELDDNRKPKVINVHKKQINLLAFRGR